MSELLRTEYENLIFHFRGMKIMLDSDLAMLYDVPTKALKEQVKRNIDRFPRDFMFKLSKIEQTELVTNCDLLSNLKHSTALSLVFTEQGVSMLFSVLRLEIAIQINIEIMRSFARYRVLISENVELKSEIRKLDEKPNHSFQFLMDKLKRCIKRKKSQEN